MAIPRQGSIVERLLAACCAESLVRARAAASKRWMPDFGTRTIAGSFLPPRESVNVFQWPRTDADAEPWEALERARQVDRVTMRVCYCSVFDECWIAETGKFSPRPVSSCPPAQPPTADPS